MTAYDDSNTQQGRTRCCPSLRIRRDITYSQIAQAAAAFLAALVNVEQRYDIVWQVLSDHVVETSPQLCCDEYQEHVAALSTAIADELFAELALDNGVRAVTAQLWVRSIASVEAGNPVQVEGVHASLPPRESHDR